MQLDRQLHTAMMLWRSGGRPQAFCDDMDTARISEIKTLINVPDNQLFRPSAWDAYGTADLEGSDFRACATYGPLYGAAF